MKKSVKLAGFLTLLLILLTLTLTSASAQNNRRTFIHRASSVDDITTDPGKNLYVIFVIDEIENELVAGDGVYSPDLLAGWEISSPVATEQKGGPGHLGVPSPGGVFTPGIAIYEGIVKNGCGTTPVFPVEFDSWLRTIMDPTHLGDFNAVDNSTLQPNGYWNFAYTIRSSDRDNVSDFNFNGHITIVYTAIETL